MFQRILVPLDGSLRAERALPLAAHIARTSQGMLILLRIVSVGAEQALDASSQEPLAHTFRHTQMEEAQQYLTALASSHMLNGIPLTVATLPGPLVTTIQSALRTYQADLLVLCAQNSPQEQSPLIGDLAEQLLTHISIPLLLISEHGPYGFAVHINQRHQATVRVAFEGQRPELSLVEPASALLAALAGKRQGHFHFVPIHVASGQPETFGFSTSTTDHLVSSGQLANNQADRSALLLKERVKETDQQQAERSRENDLLVLGLPAQSKRAAWIAEEDQQALLAGIHTPLFFVPAPEREAQ